MTAKIVSRDCPVIEARMFHATAPVEEMTAPAAAVALNRAFGKVATGLATGAMQVP